VSEQNPYEIAKILELEFRGVDPSELDDGFNDSAILAREAMRVRELVSAAEKFTAARVDGPDGGHRAVIYFTSSHAANYFVTALTAVRQTRSEPPIDGWE
jgi:hypothetical protein